MENLTGQQLGPYRIIEPLGEGGMAAVYKAFQPNVERYVALKVLPRHLAQSNEFVSRFKREASMLAQLQHPHILPVFDYGETNGLTYIAMPLLKSGTLSQRLQGEPLPSETVDKTITQLSSALDYAHSHGIIHRDIKPSNVLLDEQGNCLLTDFGIAKMVEGQDKLTSTGSIIGTPAYMSPEQGADKTLDHRSDIYSLGIILFEMLTGRVPFKAETPVAVVVKHIHSPLPLPRSLNPNLPEGVELVVLKALAKEPADRYNSAAALAISLSAAFKAEPFTADKTVIAIPDHTVRSDRTAISTAEAEFAHTVAQQKARPTYNHRKGWIVVGVSFVLVMFIFALAVIFVDSPDGNQANENPVALVETATVTNTPIPTSAATATASPTPVIETDFPMPDTEIRQFSKAAASEQIIFTTDLSAEGLLTFYREQFTAQGLVERQLLTNVGDWGFSIVFDGAANGLATVVQVTDLAQTTPDDTRSVVIRYEALD